MDCGTSLRIRAVQLEEDRLEFEKQKHKDIMALEYTRLGLKPDNQEEELSTTTLEEILGTILGGRNSF